MPNDGPMKVETSFRKLAFGHYQMSAIGGMATALAIISTAVAQPNSTDGANIAVRPASAIQLIGDSALWMTFGLACCAIEQIGTSTVRNLSAKVSLPQMLD